MWEEFKQHFLLLKKLKHNVTCVENKNKVQSCQIEVNMMT